MRRSSDKSVQRLKSNDNNHPSVNLSKEKSPEAVLISFLQRSFMQ